MYPQSAAKEVLELAVTWTLCHLLCLYFRPLVCPPSISTSQLCPFKCTTVQRYQVSGEETLYVGTVCRSFGPSVLDFVIFQKRSFTSNIATCLIRPSLYCLNPFSKRLMTEETQLATCLIRPSLFCLIHLFESLLQGVGLCMN